MVFPDDDCWYPPWFLARGFLMAATGADFLSGRAADEDGRSINGRYELKRPFWRSAGSIPRSASRFNALAIVRGAGPDAPGRGESAHGAITIRQFMVIMRRSTLKRKVAFKEKVENMGGESATSCVFTATEFGPR